MKIDFSLDGDSKLMVQLLHEVGNIEIRRFFKFFALIKEGQDSLKKMVQVFNDSGSSYGYITSADLPQLPERVEKTILGLEYIGLVKLISNQELASRYITVGGRNLSIYNIELTEEGHEIGQRLVEGRKFILRPNKKQRNTVFVASAFGKADTDLLYDNVFKLVCNQCSKKPVRVDLNEHEQTITESILRGISDSACVIADLTYARPSVYFEIGFTHGLGIPLLLTCRKDHYRGGSDNLKVHFDVEQFKISFWAQDADGNFVWDKNMEPSTRLKMIIGQ